jgi:hypothetical protein
MSTLGRRSLKIAFRLFGVAVLAYGVLLILSIGSMFSPGGGPLGKIGDVVEVVVFFPQRFLPPPSQVSNQVHWLVCAVWMP